MQALCKFFSIRIRWLQGSSQAEIMMRNVRDALEEIETLDPFGFSDFFLLNISLYIQQEKNQPKY